MSRDPRGMSLGRDGEAHWARLSASLKLEPGRMRALVVADASDVRNEVRRRLEALSDDLQRAEPAPDILEDLQARAAVDRLPPLCWIEAREVDDTRDAWTEALRALNRGRDLIADRGEISVVLAGPRWLLELVQRISPDLASVLDPIAVFDETLDPLPPVSGPLCFMHLSDLHVAGDSWEQDIVLHGLVKQLPELLAELDRRPQLLFVTGDIAARGSEAEYDAARRTLDQVCAQLGLGPDQVFLVPGNHDVDRRRISKAAERQQTALLKLDHDALRTEVGELIGNGELFAQLFGIRLREYGHFTQRFLGVARAVEPSQPWRSDVVIVSGVRVGVASVCTSWSAGGPNDKGRLIVGRRQIETLANELDEARAALRIALLHHPLSWLCEAEERELRAVLRERFDLLLHGHAHDGAAEYLHRPGRDHVEIGAGAAYAGLTRDRHHGFWIAQLDPDSGILDLDALTWDSRGSGRWRRDAGFVREAPTGRLSWSFAPPQLGASASAAAPRVELIVDALRRAARRVYAVQGFIGLPDSAPKPRASLDSMFVPLDFKREDDDARLPLRDLEGTWLCCTEASGSATRTVILGKPGSGKSTLCRYLVVVAARVDDGPIPLLLRVRNAAVLRGDTILEMVARVVNSELAVPVTPDLLGQLCTEGRAVLLIDGVDEVGTEARVRLRDCVHAFVEAHPRVPVLVTSRRVGYDEAPLDRSFTHLYLEDFDDEQLDEFIERWYEIAEPDNPSERAVRKASLQEALRIEPRARELARTPLLATLIALVHLHQAHLPGERARLYQLCIDLLVVTWPAERRRTLPDLDGYWQIARLEELALWMQRQRRWVLEKEGERPAIVIRGVELERFLVGALAAHRDEIDPGLRRSLAKKWQHHLVADCGVLQEQQPDYYGFAHLSLLEYLAGRGALRDLAGGGHQVIAAFVREHCTRPHWRECLLLMLGSEGHDRPLIEKVVENLLENPSWLECTFLVDLLREEVELTTRMREAILTAASKQALVSPFPMWKEICNSLDVITQFGHLHAEPTSAWIRRQLATCSGKDLLAILLIAPESFIEIDEFTSRPDSELKLIELLDLPPAHHWGKHVHERATPAALLEWCRFTPLAHIVLRSCSLGLLSNAPQVWVAGLLRRASWLFNVATSSARALRDKPRPGGTGLVAGLSWQTPFYSAVVACVRPAFGTTLVDEHAWAFNLELHPTPTVLDFNRLWLVGWPVEVASMFTERLSPYFVDLAQYFTLDFARDFVRHFVHESSFAVFFADFAQAFVQDEDARLGPTGVKTVQEPCCSRSTRPDWGTIKPRNQEFAEAYAGLLSSPAFDDHVTPATIIEARLQNVWVLHEFDRLVAKAQPLTDQKQALLLALGLAQAQTTNTWPDSDHWRAWFTPDTPPDYWLSAYIWHLCHAIAAPESDHLALAQACLDRGDWPELVAELRKYPVIPTPPEIAALFADK